jgi:hypothetical protein
MRNSWVVVVLCLTLGSPLASAASLQDSRLPVPEKPAEKDAIGKVHDIFKEEYSRKGQADKLALSRKLLNQALQVNDDSASQYVLLRESQDLATQSGNLESALAAIDELSKRFQIDGLFEKCAALSTAVKSAKTVEDLKAAAEAHLAVANDAMDSDSLDIALKTADTGESLARRAKDLTVAGKAAAMKKEIADAKQVYTKVKAAKETLATTPSDEGANLILGEYQCWTKGDWERGLKSLARGPDVGVRTLAIKEISDPTAPADQIIIGDAWWDIAEKETGRRKENLRIHAVQWYLKAFTKADGLNKVKLEKRIALVRGKTGESNP